MGAGLMAADMMLFRLLPRCQGAVAANDGAAHNKSFATGRTRVLRSCGQITCVTVMIGRLRQRHVKPRRCVRGDLSVLASAPGGTMEAEPRAGARA